MSVEPRTIGEVVDYPSMMRILRDRANELQIARSHEDTSDLAGLPDKYLAKLLGPRPVRRIGMKTMGAVLGVLQIKFIAVVDDEAVRHYGNRVRKRDDRLVRTNTVTVEFSHRHMKRIGKKGGDRRAELPEKERIRLARTGGRAFKVMMEAKRRLAHTGTFDWKAVKSAVKGDNANADSRRNQSQKAPKRTSNSGALPLRP